MNMRNNPTINELRALLAKCAGAGANHILWVSRDGEVHIDPVPPNVSPVRFEDLHKNMQFRFETYAAGTGYVGRSAAANTSHVREIFDDLVKCWAARREGLIDDDM